MPIPSAAQKGRIEAYIQLANFQAGKGDSDAALATLDRYRAQHPQDGTLGVPRIPAAKA